MRRYKTHNGQRTAGLHLCASHGIKMQNNICSWKKYAKCWLNGFLLIAVAVAIAFTAAANAARI